jgi:CRISPR-associated protein Cas2
MKKYYKYNYAFVLYDISDQESEVGKNRVVKVFKICKRYFKHHQKSVFRGNITPSNLISLKNELNQVIDKKLDFINIIKIQNISTFDEEILGTNPSDNESIFV